MFPLIPLLVLVLAGSLASWQAPPNTAQITLRLSGPTRDGFADTSSEIQDTLKDIRTRIEHSVPEIQLVDDAKGADLLLTVVARGTGVDAWGARTTGTAFYNSAILTTVPVAVRTRWISTVLQIGTYRKEFAAGDTNASNSSMGAWGNDAAQVVKDLRAWVQANDAMVRSKRH